MRAKRTRSVSARRTAAFNGLVSVMARLRGPGGCPWDRRQTHASLVKYLFSEAREVRQAVRRHDWDNLEEELGDILLQVIFHARIAQDAGRFTINDIIRTLTRKLIRRHPHVFGTAVARTPRQVIRQWEEIKKQERRLKKRSSAVVRPARGL